MYQFQIGTIGIYIRAERFKHVCSIPMTAAVAWVNQYYPDKGILIDKIVNQISPGKFKTSEAFVRNWDDKEFYIVENNELTRVCIALYQHDGKFEVWQQEV